MTPAEWFRATYPNEFICDYAQFQLMSGYAEYVSKVFAEWIAESGYEKSKGVQNEWYDRSNGRIITTADLYSDFMERGK